MSAVSGNEPPPPEPSEADGTEQTSLRAGAVGLAGVLMQALGRRIRVLRCAGRRTAGRKR